MKRVFAHGELTDEGINAEMHIDPNDNPIVGEEARFYFTFIDPSGQFELKRCDCTVVLLKDETELDRQPVLFTESEFASLGSFPLYTKTFSESGTYELELIGSPKDGAVFQPFQLHYDVHTQNDVSDSGYHALFEGHLAHILIFGGGLVAAVILLVRNYYQNRKNN